MFLILIILFLAIVPDGGFRRRARFCRRRGRCPMACGPRICVCGSCCGCANEPDCFCHHSAAEDAFGPRRSEYKDGGFGPRPETWV